MKKHDYFKSRFGITLEDTHIYTKENGRASLLGKNNIGGVGIQAMEITEYPECIAVESRTHFLRYALKDYAYLKRNLERNYGTVIEAYLMGKVTRRKTVSWIFYKIAEPFDEGKPVIEEVAPWEVPGLIRWL